MNPQSAIRNRQSAASQWLWPVSVFAAGIVLSLIARRLSTDFVDRLPWAVLVVGCLLSLLFSLLVWTQGVIREKLQKLAYEMAERGKAEAETRALTERLEQRVGERTAALRESEAKWRALFDESADGLILADPETRRFRIVNQQICRMLGYTETELLARSVADLHPPAELPAVLDAFQRQVRGELKVATELAVVRKDGSVFFADVTGAIIVVAGERLLLGAFRDVTERRQAAAELARHRAHLEQVVLERTKELEGARAAALSLMQDAQRQKDQLAVALVEAKRVSEELRISEKAAETANRAKSDFLAGMSHELRTPLNAIIGFSEVLADKTFGELNAKQGKYVDNVLEAGRHLLSLINDILDLSKVSAGKMTVAPVPVRIRSLLEDALVLVKERAMRHGLTLTLDAPAHLMATADERMLKQILFNLLSNAIKFTPAGGQIRVSANLSEEVWECGRMGVEESVGAEQSTGFSDTPTRPHPHAPTLLISVADTGIGIKPEDQARLFREFEQVDSNYARKHEGTGLGLALVKRFVAMHGGRVWVESEGEGKGSTFRFTLPVDTADAGSVLVRTLRAQWASTHQKPGGIALFLFVLDTDAICRANSAADSRQGVSPAAVWAALAGKVRGLGLESVFSGNEFIVTTAADNNAETVVPAKLRRLLKGVLFPMAPSAVAGFACGVATGTGETVDAVELLGAARKAQVRERDRIAAKHVVIVDDEPMVREALRKQLEQLGFAHSRGAAGGKELFRLLQGQTPDLILLDIAMPDMNGYEVIGRLKGHNPTAEIPILILSGRDVDSEELRKKSPTTAIPVLVKPVDPAALNNHVSYLL